ncbi:divalent cation tolerance protein [Actinopolyspora xinjiangensis]|uniref:Divalent cation tolerance protein n=1 Tax=Actinopolyspora xinjiangensis TaxID=405564 RepID=A0A1H0WTH9_9ACTN|nr:divalent-cation tolerance protein CutA [Actinopolyspora xinjiangensis]SDP93745.1 divalent cation tolerance protein [Actinopolyspora xinjiangensis]
MTEYVQVVTTTDSEHAAGELARGVVDARLGACVQVVPIRSFFRWEGGVEDEQEWQLQIKTSRDRVTELREHLEERHNYDVPEIIAVPIVTGNDQYLSWVKEETTP